VRWRSTRFRLLQSAGRFQVLADSSRTYEPYLLSVPDVQAMGDDLQFALGHVGRLPVRRRLACRRDPSAR
jgi:hypothetical protein